jgi:hypothetical protein
LEEGRVLGGGGDVESMQELEEDCEENEDEI